MKRYRNYRNKKIVNKVIAGCMIAALSVGMMTGCGDSRTVTEQVNELLTEQMNSQSPSWEQVEDTLQEDEKPETQPEEMVSEEEDNLSTTEDLKEEEPLEEIELDWGEVEVDETVLTTDGHKEVKEDEKMMDEEDHLQLVFLGDSIFDMARDGTGVPYLTAEALDASCYNLAIGGTCAALHKDESADYEKWDSSSVLGVAKAVAGLVSPDAFSKYHAKDVFDTCDFSKTDYFIVECGTNDFLSQYPIDLNQGGTYQWYTYYWAVYAIVGDLLNAYPDAKVIFCTPHYEQFYFKDKGIAGDVNILDLGRGPLINYIAAGHNAAQMAGAYAINCYDELPINGYTADDYLLDGIHLTEEGRRVYAEMLVKTINHLEMESGN
ncbi:MAG: SGNH/GDSL hydrolase family protein [Clostridiales bacterium]|nr:SGNH/GDSL hydrolase family protein [Clostridiales bacterium]